MFHKYLNMTNIILPSDEEEKQDDELTYAATEEDEERFFLMYHMDFQPSEVEALKPDYRKWLIARFIAQKNLEQEAMQRQKLMQQIGPSLKV